MGPPVHGFGNRDIVSDEPFHAPKSVDHGRVEGGGLVSDQKRGVTIAEVQLVWPSVEQLLTFAQRAAVPEQRHGPIRDSYLDGLEKTEKIRKASACWEQNCKNLLYMYSKNLKDMYMPADPL